MVDRDGTPDETMQQLLLALGRKSGKSYPFSLHFIGVQAQAVEQKSALC